MESPIIAADPRWLHTLLASLERPQRSPLGELIPEFPPAELQRNTTGLDGAEGIRQAVAFHDDVLDAMRRAGRVLDAGSSVLDFGFGWGRISRVFMGEVPKSGIHGIDVDPEFVALTRAAFDSPNFVLCPPFPPTPYADASFDLVYAYSVFSHLSERACREWMQEFSRIVKPGGMVAFTTRHESFFDYCASLSDDPDAQGYQRALGTLFADIDDARSRYRRGEIVHASSEGVGGGGPRDASFYGETWIPEAYAATAFGDAFELVGNYFDGSRYDQACFVLRRR